MSDTKKEQLQELLTKLSTADAFESRSLARSIRGLVKELQPREFMHTTDAAHARAVAAADAVQRGKASEAAVERPVVSKEARVVEWEGPAGAYPAAHAEEATAHAEDPEWEETVDGLRR